jgi:hypothetical protein
VKQRRFFVLLALRAPEAVSAEELLEAVWGSERGAVAVNRYASCERETDALVLHRLSAFAPAG